MKIAMVVPEYWPFSFGGGPVHYRSFSHALRRHGYEVQIYSGLWGEWSGELDPDVRYFRLLRPPVSVNGADIRAYMPPTIRGMFDMRIAAKSMRADIVHCFGYGFVFNDMLAKLSGLPTIYTVMGAPNRPYAAPPHVRAAFSLYNRLSGHPALLRARVVHGISSSATDHPDLKRFKAAAITIPNGVDRPTVAPLPVPGFTPDRPFIFSVGRIQESKGFQTVIQALSSLLAYDYVIAGGDIGYRDTLQDLACRHGVEKRVHILGYMPDAQREWLYEAADIIAIPSLFEPFGLVSLEAMIRGKLVVAAATEGLAETITDGVDGLLYAPGQPQDFVRAVESLHGRRHAIQQAAILRASQQTWDEIVRRFGALYRLAAQ